MGFFSGRATFTRFQVAGHAPKIFGPEHLAKIAENTAGRQRLASANGVEAGWAAGDHILDTRFDLAKNIIDDMLFFALRIDMPKIAGRLAQGLLSSRLGSPHRGKPERPAQLPPEARSQGIGRANAWNTKRKTAAF